MSGRERWVVALVAVTWGGVSGFVVAAFGWSVITVVVVALGAAATLTVGRLVMDTPRSWRRYFSITRTGKPVGKRWVVPSIVGAAGLVMIGAEPFLGLIWVAWAVVMLMSMILEFATAASHAVLTPTARPVSGICIGCLSACVRCGGGG